MAIRAALATGCALAASAPSASETSVASISRKVSTPLARAASTPCLGASALCIALRPLTAALIAFARDLGSCSRVAFDTSSVSATISPASSRARAARKPLTSNISAQRSHDVATAPPSAVFSSPDAKPLMKSRATDATGLPSAYAPHVDADFSISVRCASLYSPHVNGGSITADLAATAENHSAASAVSSAPAVAFFTSSCLHSSWLSRPGPSASSPAASRLRMRCSSRQSNTNASCADPPCARPTHFRSSVRGGHASLPSPSAAHAPGGAASRSSIELESHPMHSLRRDWPATSRRDAKTSAATLGPASSALSSPDAALHALLKTGAMIFVRSSSHSRLSAAAFVSSTLTPSMHIAATSAATRAHEESPST
mmetsp:Transcript_9346/g.29137  ORF Transcript_9346/g.29137 Transcript_9346/m.29137 type:complete len:372 (-) Transcript_9346:1421-2536(-)